MDKLKDWFVADFGFNVFRNVDVTEYCGDKVTTVNFVQMYQGACI